MRRLLLAAALLFLGGCAEVLDLGRYRSSEESDAATSTSVGSGGGGAGGGPTTKPAELCTDGIDNDSDGAIDCEDDACANYECLPAPPAGWVGPVALAIGDPSGLPQCPGGRAEFEGGNGPAHIPPAECPCTCSAPQLGCQAQFDPSTEQSCALPTITTTGVNCVPMGFNEQYVWVGVTPSNASCSVTSTDPPPAGVSWPMMARSCAATAGSGCGEQVCVGMPAGFERLCVYRAGEASCPSADYTEQHVVERYIMENDSRDCDIDCSCYPNGAACGGSFTAYDSGNCTGNSTPIYADQCNDAGFTIASVDYTPMVSGSCVPIVRTPVGGVTPFDTTTVCCKPR